MDMYTVDRAEAFGFRELRNHTPHPIDLIAPDGSVTTLPPIEPCVRLTYETQQIAVAAGIPVLAADATSVVGLPPVEPGVGLIVSRACAERVIDRPLPHTRYDLLCPEEFVRDEAGRVVGCRALLSRQAMYRHPRPA